MSHAIEVILTPALFDTKTTATPYTAIAVDVLRATTSMCAALYAGAEHIVPLDSLEELDVYAQKGYTLAAERNGHKINGATCGNSPTEYLQMNLEGQHIAYSTTNGTRCVLKAASEGQRTLIGCLCNLDTIAQKAEGQDIIVLCSGWKRRPSMEDTLFAGAMTEIMLAKGYTMIEDSTAMALALWKEAKSDIMEYCQRAAHVKRLQNMNYQADIELCLQPNTIAIAPEYHNGIITR